MTAIIDLYYLVHHFILRMEHHGVWMEAALLGCRGQA
jgi:hypothetical protein